jgi:N-acetylneuraminate synthase
MKIYIIAEIGINHNGNMELAKELIDTAGFAGCDAVKFQKRTIDIVYTREELDKYRESPWGTTTREQKEGLEFNIIQHKELELYTLSKNMDFIVSCWDLNSLKEIDENCNVKYHKIASALMTYKDFLKAINKTKKPVIVSTGMCTPLQVNESLSSLDNAKYILACTSTYPTKSEEVNLRYISTLKEMHPHIDIGFSNHYNGMDACIGAAALGAKCIEFHITKNRTMYGSDQPASIQHVNELVNGIRNMESMRGVGVKVVYESELPIIEKLRKK